jgi:hypothetical protein
VTLKGARIAEEFQDLVERYIERTYAPIVPVAVASPGEAVTS